MYGVQLNHYLLRPISFFQLALHRYKRKCFANTLQKVTEWHEYAGFSTSISRMKSLILKAVKDFALSSLREDLAFADFFVKIYRKADLENGE